MILCLLDYHNSVAQTNVYHPLIRSNTYWQWQFSEYPGSMTICVVDAGYEVFFQGDTVFQGLSYNIVRGYPIVSLLNNGTGPYCQPYAVNKNVKSSIQAYMREDTVTKRVYIYRPMTADSVNYKGDLLYDFSLKAGDSLLMSRYQMISGIGTALVVDRVHDTILQNGASRKVFYFEKGNSQYYVESIGSFQGLYSAVERPFEGNEYLDCVSSDSTQLWGSCFSILTCVPELERNNTFSLFPNPAQDRITVELSAEGRYDLSMSNILGQVVSTLQFTGTKTELDASTLPKGVYFVQVSSDQSKTAKKVVIQ